MASDMTAAALPFHTERVALSATPGNVVRVDLPPWARKFTVNFRKSDNTDDSGRVASAGTDAAAIGNDCFPCPSGSALSWNIPAGRTTRSVYITGDTASGFGYVLLEGAI